MEVMLECGKLRYEIHRYSSFSTNYYPENILVNAPTDQTSRWSVHTNTPPQFLTLKLQRPAVVQKIKFGKFEKAHVCNIKKFRIYGGLAENRMVLLLEGGLKNDNVPEVFNLRCLTEDGSKYLPVLYVKIVPLLSWGPTFNFSIWYIELLGLDDPMFTSTSMKQYNLLRETEIVKLCLKHFRQQGYEKAFQALQQQTQVRLEHPHIEALHKSLVLEGDFDGAECLIASCVADGFMDEYLHAQDYKHSWCMQHTQSDDQPGNRGGHQLVMDTNRRVIYLYGGWDGFQDLSDLWVYNIEANSWTLLCQSSQEFNGPTPRSCHKMVFDPVSENIFMLGRYLDNSIRTTEYIKSDFFLYDTRARNWLQICDDTSHVGGPQLVYDHQMCIDAEKRTIYVFGGKVLTPRSVTTCATNEPEYSGLFSYHIATNTWTQILVDCHHPSAAQADVLSIKSRITHCMVFHNKNRKLFIYGGQRGKEDIIDFITYDVDTQSIEVLNRETDHQANSNANVTSKNEPPPGYTLRATIDCDRNEIYVFSSLSKFKDRRDIQYGDASNSFWVYSLETNRWSRIYHYKHNSGDAQAPADLKSPTTQDPCPRYAHQLIYDDMAKMHYLFGGNPGKSNLPQLRLDDFWILLLEKPKREEVLRRCRYLLRKLHYEEMVRFDPYQAMQFLRNHIAEVIDHSDAEQLNNFHKLASVLFRTEEQQQQHDPNTDEQSSMDTPSLAGGDKGENIDGAASPPAATNDNETADGEGAVAVAAAVAIVANAKQEEQQKALKSDAAELTNALEDLYESCESTGTTTSSTSFELSTSTATSTSGTTSTTDMASYALYRKSGGKRALPDYLHELKSRRSFLFNQLVRLMPSHMVQPERNLSDFVVM